MEKEIVMYRNHKIEISQSDSNDSPNDWEDDERFLVYDHRQFCVKRKGYDPDEIFEIWQIGGKLYNGYWIIPVSAYIHSGVSLSIGESHGWDTSFKGFALIKKMYNCETIEESEEQAKGLLETWNQYLNGEVYDFQTEFDSCGGYYGDPEKSGLMNEAKTSIDYAIKEKLQKRIKQVKAYILNKVPLINRQPLII